MMHEQFKWHDVCPNAVQLSPNKFKFTKLA